MNQTSAIIVYSFKETGLFADVPVTDSTTKKLGARNGIGLFCVLLLCSCNSDQDCYRGHTHKVHHEEWVQFITTSFDPLIQVPIIHPAEDTDDLVCDQTIQKHNLEVQKNKRPLVTIKHTATDQNKPGERK